jgi:hypothetical protein
VGTSNQHQDPRMVKREIAKYIKPGRGERTGECFGGGSYPKQSPPKSSRRTWRQDSSALISHDIPAEKHAKSHDTTADRGKAQSRRATSAPDLQPACQARKRGGGAVETACWTRRQCARRARKLALVRSLHSIDGMDLFPSGRTCDTSSDRGRRQRLVLRPGKARRPAVPPAVSWRPSERHVLFGGQRGTRAA